MSKATIVVLSLTNPDRLLEELADQTFKDSFEVIIAKEKGIVNAMNKALDKARGDIFIRIDDDVSVPTSWLKALVDTFDNPSIAGVTGPTFIPPFCREERDSIRIMNNPNFFLRWLFDGDPFAPAKIYKCGSVSYGSNFREHLEDKDYQIDHLEGTNWAMRTHLIRQVGGFDPLFDGVAEWFDDDVLFKIKKLGYKIKYNPKAYLWHMVNKSETYGERFAGAGRIKNWLRFHWRHSEFHPKKILWLMLMIGYFIKCTIWR